MQGYKTPLSPLATLLTPFFKDLLIFFDTMNKLSFIDIHMTNSTLKSTQSLTLFDSIFTDLQILLTVNDLKLSTYYQSNFQNVLTSVMLNAPEIFNAFFEQAAAVDNRIGVLLSQTYSHVCQSLTFHLVMPLNILTLLTTA